VHRCVIDPQTLHNQLILEGEGEGQPVRFIGSPIELSRAPVGLRRGPPRLGQHTEEVLQQLRGKVATEAV
jgi:crotonobetainyl-CoA:carnitine CoA-transferase CaiB-like acyl-CoA transferase